MRIQRNCAVRRLSSGARRDIQAVRHGRGATIVRGNNLRTPTMRQMVNQPKGRCTR